MDGSTEWLKLHPKVKTALAWVGALVAGQAVLVLQGSESVKEAGVATALAVSVAIAAYLGPQAK